MKISWMKLDINILDNDKIKLIRKYPDGDSLFVLWIGLLTIAMKSDLSGHILISKGTPYSPEDLASILDIPIKTVHLGLELFSRFGMIQLTEYNEIVIKNFREKQEIKGILDAKEAIEYKKEQSRESTKRWREKKKSDKSVTSQVTSRDTSEKRREEKRREEKKDIRTPKKIKYRDNVKLTKEEYNKLLTDYDKKTINLALDKLDNYKGSTGKKYKSDYRTLLNWVVESVGGRKKTNELDDPIPEIEF